MYECRPTPCRKFDCRDDKRIWLDFTNRIVAPLVASSSAEDKTSQAEIEQEVKQQQVALMIEELALTRSPEDD